MLKKGTDQSSTRPFIVTDVSNNCNSCEVHVRICFLLETAESSPKKGYFRPCVFLVLLMKTSISSAHSVPAIQFNCEGYTKPDLPMGAFTVMTLHDIHWWPLTLGK